MRRFGERVQVGQRYRDRPGAYAVLLRAGRVLLTHQAEPVPEWQLPGGGIDPGESPVAALHREVAEETGWAIAVPRRLGAYQRFAYMPEYDLWARKICHIYLARPVTRRGPPTEPGHAVGWFTPDTALERLASAGDRHMLARLLRIG